MAKKTEKTEETLFGLNNLDLSTVDSITMQYAIDSIKLGKRTADTSQRKENLTKTAMDVIACFPRRLDLQQYLTSTSQSYLDNGTFGIGDAKVSADSKKTLVTANRERFARFFHRAWKRSFPLSEYEMYGTKNFQFRLYVGDKKTDLEKLVKQAIDIGMDITSLEEIKESFSRSCMRSEAMAIERNRSTIEKQKAQKAREKLVKQDKAINALLDTGLIEGMTPAELVKALASLEQKTA